MLKLNFSELSQENLQSIVKLYEKGIVSDKWNRMMLACTDQERQQLQFFTLNLINRRVVAMNEATIWSRAIYPLLMFAEKEHIQAWSQVSLKAQYPRFELESVVDGVLANTVSGRVEAPYLVVLQAKRGIEGKDPQFQLYGEMLAATWLNWQETAETPQEIFGCYTVSDSWTFARSIVEEMEAENL